MGERRSVVEGDDGSEDGRYVWSVFSIGKFSMNSSGIGHAIDGGYTLR